MYVTWFLKLLYYNHREMLEVVVYLTGSDMI